MEFYIEQSVNTRGSNVPLLYPQVLHPGDNLAHVWRVKVHENGKPVSLEGANVACYAMRSDGGAPVLITGTAQGSVASVKMPQAFYACPGDVAAEMVIATADDRVVTTAVLHCRVGRQRGNTVVDPGKAIGNINMLLAQVDVMKAASADAVTARDAANAAAGNAAMAAESADTAAALARAAAAGAEDVAGRVQAKLDNGELTGVKGDRGETGAPFTYADFTAEQLEGLRGPKGDRGETGPQGPVGEQGTVGPRGDSGTSVVSARFVRGDDGSEESPVIYITGAQIEEV